jgi:general secretion pathway protein J
MRESRPQPKRALAQGFTLLELLVALFISAVMFSLGYAALNQAATQQSRLQETQQSLADLQRTMRFLSQDFAQLAPRQVRDELGRSVEPALLFDPRQSGVVTLTRGGQSLVFGEPRGRLLRVRYVIEGDVLVRLTTPVLDRTPASPPWRRQELIKNVAALEIRALDATDEWRDSWPSIMPAVAGAGPADVRSPIATLRIRPKAVELRLQLRDRGELRRLIEVTG